MKHCNFGDRIPKGINRGPKLFKAKVFYRLFFGATSRDFFHYIKPTLQDPRTEWVLMNLGSTAVTVSNSILHIANQCNNYGVKKTSILSTKNPIDVHLEQACIAYSSCEKLLGITIDSDLKFDKHISDSCNKVGKKINALCQVKDYRL